MKLQIKGTELMKCDPMGAKEVIVPEGITKIHFSAFDECSSLQTVILPDGLEEIGCWAFQECSGLQSIVIPASVTLIERCAFLGCTNLASVSISPCTKVEDSSCFRGTPWYKALGEWKIINGVLLEYTGQEQHITVPDTVTEIAAEAFKRNSSIQSVALPNSLRVIGRQAFSGRGGLQTINLPDGLVSIGYAAFERCGSLLSIHIPDSVTELGEKAFDWCRNLKELHISANIKRPNVNMFWWNEWLQRAAAPLIINGVLLKYNVTDSSVELPQGIWTWDTTLFQCNEMVKTVIVPEGITVVPAGAFDGCSQLSKVVLPQSLEKIEALAFRNCIALKSIKIPDGVTIIGHHAFDGCCNLKTLRFPSKLTAIEAEAFQSCALDQAILPESVVSIGDGAFRNCTQLIKVTVPADMHEIGNDAFALTPFFQNAKATLFLGTCLIKYIGDAENYTVPDHVTHIMSNAFSSRQFKKVILPESVRRIGHSAFTACRELTEIVMPSRLEQSLFDVFRGCIKLQSITIPEGVTTIGRKTFLGCSALSRVIFSDSIEYIYGDAFSGCSNLEYLELPSVDVDVDQTAFADCEKIKTKFRNFVELKTTEKLSTDGLSLNPIAEDEGRAWVLMFQSTKAWGEWAVRTAEEPETVLQYCMQLIEDEKKPSVAMVKRLINFMLDCKSRLNTESIMSMLDLLEKKKCKVERKLFGVLKPKKAPQKSKSQEDPYADFVAECIKDYAFADEAIKAIKADVKISYQGKKTTASLDEIRFIVSEYAHQWHQCKSSITGGMGRAVEILPMSNVMNVTISCKAERIVDKLNRTALDRLLRTLAEGTRYRPFLLAYARFATDSETAYIISKIRSKRRGTAQEKYWSSNMEAALLINDTREAMQFFEDDKHLDAYAQRRGVTAQELRDSTMMPDFGFDSDGVKRYDIGGNIIEVTIAPDLTCQLFDTGKQKVIKTMPKKSDDPEKAASCAENFSEFKKKVQQFYKQRMAIMHELHTEGTSLSGETWKKTYLGHPVLKYLTKLLVWQDETGKSFMPVEEGIVDVNGVPYEPQGKITLAHVLTLRAEETDAWQSYLSSRHLAQPFAQVWEPVVQWSDKKLKKRYEGATVSKTARNAVKKALDTWGITMRSETQEGYFNHSTFKYQYSNEGTLNFEDCYYLDYTVDPDTGDTTFASGRKGWDSTGKERTARIMNAVLMQLDLAVAASFAARDQVDKLAQVKLENLTVVQLSNLINVAVENNAAQCTAYLLNLKQQSFAAFEQADDLVLDW